MAALKNLAVVIYSGIFSPYPPQKITHMNAKKSCAESIIPTLKNIWKNSMSDLPENLKYATSHEWAKLENDNIVRVGITDFAQEELGDLVFIELPEVGQKVSAAEQCAVVESVKTASDLYSPVNGEIVEVNEALADAPEMVNDDAYAAWLFCIKADNPLELDQLMNVDEYESLIDS